MRLKYIQEQKLGDCTRCKLHKTRTNIVFGRGSPNAKIMFVGEAPGSDEDRQGVPFCGRSGELLDQWLEKIGLLEDCYIANIIKCRPPNNRNPSHVEISHCLSFLHLQIMVIQPHVLVALGRVAACTLSERPGASMGDLRNDHSLVYRCQETGMEVPLVATYHPSYVLRREGGYHEHGEVNNLVLSDLKRAIDFTSYSIDGDRKRGQRKKTDLR